MQSWNVHLKLQSTSKHCYNEWNACLRSDNLDDPRCTGLTLHMLIKSHNTNTLKWNLSSTENLKDLPMWPFSNLNVEQLKHVQFGCCLTRLALDERRGGADNWEIFCKNILKPKNSTKSCLILSLNQYWSFNSKSSKDSRKNNVLGYQTSYSACLPDVVLPFLISALGDCFLSIHLSHLNLPGKKIIVKLDRE